MGGRKEGSSRRVGDGWRGERKEGGRIEGWMDGMDKRGRQADKKEGRRREAVRERRTWWGGREEGCLE